MALALERFESSIFPNLLTVAFTHSHLTCSASRVWAASSNFVTSLKTGETVSRPEFLIYNFHTEIK